LALSLLHRLFGPPIPRYAVATERRRSRVFTLVRYDLPA
jgi:hypothetical protein